MKFILNYLPAALALALIWNPQASACPSPNQYDFHSPRAVPLGNVSYPWGVTSDLNGDGWIDIVTSRPAVMINRGSGFFQEAASLVDYGDPEPSGYPVVADFDMDGKLDIISPLPDKSLVFFKGRGDGSFEPKQVIAVMGYKPEQIISADVNGDSRPDLIVSNTSSNVSRQISIVLNKIGGVFEISQNISAPDTIWHGNMSGYISAADIDGDGDVDILTFRDGRPSDFGMSGMGFQVFSNNSQGHFTPQPVVPTIDVPMLYSPWGTHVLTDLDGDGDLDLALLTRVNDGVVPPNGPVNLWVYRNTADGSFSAGEKFQHDAIVVNTLRAADLDANGYPELMAYVGGSIGALTIYSNDAGNIGAYSTRNDLTHAVMIFDADGDGDLDILNSGGQFTGALSINKLYSDCNRNGRRDDLDICDGSSADCNSNAVPDECDARPELSFDEHVVTLPANISGDVWSESIVVGDLNSDGRKDIAFSLLPSGIGMLFRDASGSFENGFAIATEDREKLVAIADISGDGSADLISSTPLGVGGQRKIMVYPGNGMGGFGQKFTAVEYPQSNNYLRQVEVADLNGDGKLDLIYVYGFTNTFKVYWARNLGNGQFATSQVASGTNFAVADIAGDGRSVVAIISGALVNLAAFDQNGVQSLQALPLKYGGAANLTLADLNADGTKDLIYRSGLRTCVEFIRISAGQYSLEPALYEYSSFSEGYMTTFDFDGDGSIDISRGYNIQQGHLTFLINNREGGAEPFYADEAVVSASAGSGNGIIVEDLNSDGKPDLVRAAGSPRELMVHINTSSPGNAPGCSKCPGDANADGYIDQHDLGIVLAAMGTVVGDSFYNPAADMDSDGDVDQSDLAVVLSGYGTQCVSAMPPKDESSSEEIKGRIREDGNKPEVIQTCRSAKAKLKKLRARPESKEAAVKRSRLAAKRACKKS